MFIVVVILVSSLALTGCFWRNKTPDKPDDTKITGTDNENITENPKENNDPSGTEENNPDPGKLVGVRYESSGGSMEFHTEFDIDVNEQEIVYTSYYSDYYFDDKENELGEKKLKELDAPGRFNMGDTGWDKNRVERKNAPVDKELWNVLVEEFEYLKPKLEEIPEFTKEDSHKQDEDMQMLDGGDYFLLHLTFEKDGVTRTAQYRTLSGKRWSTILATLHEMVRPVGRDLKRIGETQLLEMYLSTKNYSYQISPIKDDPGKYYFNVHEDKYTCKTVKEKQWIVVRDHINAMDLSSFQKGSYGDKYFLQLKYNDGDVFYYLIDKDTADGLKQFILDQKF